MQLWKKYRVRICLNFNVVGLGAGFKVHIGCHQYDNWAGHVKFGIHFVIIDIQFKLWKRKEKCLNQKK